MAWQQLLKSYELDEFIIKTEKKKKAPVKDNLDGDSVLVYNRKDLERVINNLKGWLKSTKGLTLADIGITGQKKRTLYEHIDYHVLQEVKRKGKKTTYGPGVQKYIKLIIKIIAEGKAIQQGELKRVDLYIKALQDVENTPGTNPKNIPFTVPIKLDKNNKPTKWGTVRGHYRTPEYVKYRKSKGKKEQAAVDSSWYDFTDDDNGSTARPPFWQALFLPDGDSNDINIQAGLLPLLIKFKEESPLQELHKLHVKGKFEREDLQNLEAFIEVLESVLSEQDSYRDTSGTKPFDRLWVNYAQVKRRLQQEEIILETEEESNFVKKVTGHDDEVGTIKSFYIDDISLGLLRTIIKNKIDTDKFEHGQGLKGIFIAKPINAQETQPKVYNREKKNSKDNLPGWVKKSWSYYLRGDY